jgi:mono/diheme cytochrome c family protein
MHAFGRSILGLALVACGAAVACGGGGGGTPVKAPDGTGTASTASTGGGSGGGGGGGDAERGAKIFADNCASCHGDKGEGSGGGPAVVGKDALPVDPPKGAKTRTMKFNNAMDVYKYIKDQMPQDNPGGLKDEEYWDVLAFDLKANGVDVSKGVNASTAESLKPH